LPFIGIGFFIAIKLSLIELLTTIIAGIIIYSLFFFFKKLYSHAMETKEIIASIYISTFIVFLYRTLIQSILTEVNIALNCINCLVESLIIFAVLVIYKIIKFKGIS